MGQRKMNIICRLQSISRTLRLFLLLLPVALVALIFLDTIFFIYRRFNQLIVPDAIHWQLLFISFFPLVYFECSPSKWKKLYLMSAICFLTFGLMALVVAFFL